MKCCCLLSKYFQIPEGRRFLGMEEATFEDLAFGFRSWREVD
jgi:hypothetical protein